MIVAFSTSSPVASVALLSADGYVLASASEQAPQGASGACLRHLERLLLETGRTLHEADLFLADLGPGSFTGVKVAVTLAKTFAFALGKPAGGAPSFDLIDPHGIVVMPSKRGELFVRTPGREPERSAELPPMPYRGFGPGVFSPEFPDAARFAEILAKISPVTAGALVPNYLIEPSISVPKKPYLAPGGHVS